MLFNYVFSIISCLVGSSKPSSWFCVIGTNDLRNVRESEMIMNRQRFLEGFIDFFKKLRTFSPGSKIFWVSIGHVRKVDRSYSAFKLFENFVHAKKPLFPHWLTFKDITWDCSDNTIKDQFGHWNNLYMKTISRRLTSFVLEHSSTGIENFSNQ